MAGWIKTASLYRDPRILATLFLGFSSGLPFLLTLATLHVWLAEVGISKTSIGLFVFITLPYSLKFLWAPFVDYVPIPFFSSFFGQRKGWMLASQCILILSLILLGATNPQDHLFLTAFFGVCVAFASATQDTVIEAFRVESLKGPYVGLGAGASSLGYRLGLWVAGAGALYLASYFSWFVVYTLMGCCIFMGMLTTLLSPEPAHEASKVHTRSFMKRLREHLKDMSVSLFNRQDVGIIISFILFYKIGDTVLNTMTMPFLIEIGFSKIEIAHVAKAFGIGAMMVGGVVGGLILSRKPLFFSLLLASFLQISASLMFCAQASIGHHLPFLFLTMGVESFACGLGTASFIAYLTSRCSQPHTATHFALFTSFGSLCRVIISSGAGFLADHYSWTQFYGMTALLCLPCLILVLFMSSFFRYKEEEDSYLDAV